jgi:hypothetical protein
MAAVFSPGAEHDAFAQWATAKQGVTVNGVAPARFEGRGLGLVAARDLKEGELLVSVPASTLITIDDEDNRNLKLPKSATVHGRLAAYLTIQAASGNELWYSQWQDVWPTMEDFRSILPLCWDNKLHEYLTPAAKGRKFLFPVATQLLYGMVFQSLH